MRFAHPTALLLLLAVPLLLLAEVASAVRRRRRLARLGDASVIARMISAAGPGKRVFAAVATLLAVLLVTLALARPQAGGRSTLQKQTGLDIVVALDFSKSMLARDIYPSRLERAKRELERLMDHLSGDRIGLVAFAGETLTYPPTTDYAAVKLFWRDLGPGDMPVGGTAIGRAIKASLTLLKALRRQDVATRGQAILLLTDGEDTESEPLAAADEAAALGVKIFTVGIGSRSGELIPEVNEAGEVTGYLKDQDGKYVTSRLAEDMLGQLAQKTDGAYLRADAKSFGVEQVEAQLRRLKRTENEARVVKQYDEIYELLLIPAFLLLVGEACLDLRRRAAKRAPGPPVAVSALLLVLLPLVAGGWSPLQKRNPAVEQGLAQMQQGHPEEALAAFDRAAAESPADPRVQFDRGTALAALSRWDDAAAAFLRATEAKETPDKAAAFYNLANTLSRADKHAEAIEAYKRALALDPKNEAAKWNLEIATRRKKDEEKKQQQDKQDQKSDAKPDNKQQGQNQSPDTKPQDPKSQTEDPKTDPKPDPKKDPKQDGTGKNDPAKDQQKPEKAGDDKPKDSASSAQGPESNPPQEKPGQSQAKTPERKDDAQPGATPAQPAEAAKSPTKPGDLRAIEGILDNLERSPRALEQERARLRAVRRRPPQKDW